MPDLIRLEYRDVTMRFAQSAGPLTAVSGVNIAVRDGEVVSLIGPSGCGKSTLLNIGSGLTAPSEGQAFVDGERVEGPNAHVAFMLQKDLLLPWRTVVENVMFGVEIQGVAAAERRRRAQALLENLKLAEFSGHYPHQLSGGMRQRSAIARAFVTDPGMLLMDEPFAALDAQNRVILQGELVRLWEQTGKTVIYVTHSIEEALLMGDRTVIMTAQPGRIKRIIDVPFPHPRDLIQLSASPEFGRLKLDIWRVLEEEVNRARAEMEL